MTPKVSVVVPVYNPGSHIDDCLRSLLEQSLPASEYEAIFVDDGSTDGTGARLDALAAEYSHLRVEHIPNSGWPGRPRNVGTDLARGEYVLYVDNDDWLGPEALERLYERAKADDADVVVGKVVGHGKLVSRGLFRRNRSNVTLDWEPLLRLLSPHKLFRRAFLAEHGIRFPEGRRRLEDHIFVMHAYFHARAISVLADYPCYHWVLRSEEENASKQPFDPVGYFDNLREVLDLIDAHTEPGPFRDRLYANWYRGKMLKRVGGANMVRRDPAYRRELYAAVRTLTLERIGEGVDDHLPFNMRVRSRLLRDGRYEALEVLAHFEAALKARAEVVAGEPEGDDLVVRLQATLAGPSGPLLLERRGGRLLWVPPAELAELLPERDRDVTDDVEHDWLEVLIRSTADRAEYPIRRVTQASELRAAGEDGLVAPYLTGEARISAATAAGGAALPEGEWQLRVLPRIAGLTVFLAPVAAEGRPLRLTVSDGAVRRAEPRRDDGGRRVSPALARLARGAKRRLRP